MSEVLYHRLRYMLSPQLDLYRGIADRWAGSGYALDFGAGTGVGALQLVDQGWTVDVWDPDEDARHFSRDTLGGIVRTLDQYPLGRYDLVLAIEVLEHTSDPDATLDQLRTLLNPMGGRLVVSSINRDGAYVKNHAHVREWGPVEFAKLIEEHADGPVELLNGHLEELLPYQTPMVATWAT